MQLKDYIPKIDKKIGKTFFSGLTFDSSKVKKDNIFFAIRGEKFDGNDYINKAIKNGAKVIISENKKLKKKRKYNFFIFSKHKKIISQYFI